MQQPLKLFVRLFLLSSLITCFRLLPTAFTESRVNQDKRNITVAITQLELQNGTPPLEVRCTSAELDAANQLAGFSCTLRNNTTKDITGVSLSYSILLDTSGGKVKDTHSWVIESLIHPDFQETYSPIAPGTETIMNAASMSFGDAIPRVIELNVDYVEFGDGGTLGPNLEGSKIIADMRYGASQYKQWLAREYIKRGKSESALASLVQTDDQALPDDLKVLQSNANQEQGARAYRILLRKLLVRKGPTELKKHFPR